MERDGGQALEHREQALAHRQIGHRRKLRHESCHRRFVGADCQKIAESGVYKYAEYRHGAHLKADVNALESAVAYAV